MEGARRGREGPRSLKAGRPQSSKSGCILRIRRSADAC